MMLAHCQSKCTAILDTRWKRRNYRTVHCGKPAVITPFYGDQYLNAVALVERGFGFLLPLEEITAERIL